jgi:UDP-N-acetylglucosamine 2-epimerase (non-hydrolysing)
VNRPRALVVLGTRPEAIKLATVVRALGARGVLRPVVLSTGQHREMLDQALEALDLAPDVDLEVMRPRQGLADVTARILEGTARVIADIRPEYVIVQGDTSTAFAAALAGYYARGRVAHVEAGLRSGDRDTPFPEEANRRLVDQLSDVLFAPTAAAGRTLLSEGHDAARVHVTGNTVVDALLAAREEVRRRALPIPGVPERLLERARVVLVTAHRRESFGAPLRAICRGLLRIVRSDPDVVIVYPVHLNPEVDGTVRELLGGEPRILLPPPLPYLGFVSLLDRATLVLTDSGGLQEEAPTFGKPVLVLREVTERPEGVDAGVARLVGTDPDRIAGETLALLRSPAALHRMSCIGSPYGDGLASARIAEILERGVVAARELRPAGGDVPRQSVPAATGPRNVIERLLDPVASASR